MNPECFNTVGQCLLNVCVDERVSVTYVQPTATVTLSANDKLEQPAFTGKFKLAPGTVEAIAESGKAFNVKLCPDLGVKGTSLTILPMKGGQFNFKTTLACPDCPCCNAEFAFDSEKRCVCTTLNPCLKYRDTNFVSKISCCGKDYSIRNGIEHKLFTLRNGYDSKDKLVRLGLFTECCKRSFGASIALDKTNVKEARLYAKGNCKSCTVAAIAEIKPELSLQLRSTGSFDCKHGNTKIAGVLDIKKCCQAACEKQDCPEKKCCFANRPTKLQLGGVFTHKNGTVVKAAANCCGKVSVALEREIAKGAKLRVAAAVPNVLKCAKECKPVYSLALTITE